MGNITTVNVVFFLQLTTGGFTLRREKNITSLLAVEWNRTFAVTVVTSILEMGG